LLAAREDAAVDWCAGVAAARPKLEAGDSNRASAGAAATGWSAAAEEPPKAVRPWAAGAAESGAERSPVAWAGEALPSAAWTRVRAHPGEVAWLASASASASVSVSVDV